MDSTKTECLLHHENDPQALGCLCTCVCMIIRKVC